MVKLSGETQAAMSAESQSIEVEVVEIDGVVPSVRAEPRVEQARGEPQWQQWHGKIRRLDSRWWPLWVFLGLIAIVLMLTLGVVFAVIFLIYRFISSLVRAIFR